MNNQTTTKNVKYYAKRYGYYGILAVTTLALVLVIALTTNNTNPNQNPAGEINVGAGAIVFSSPVANASILKGYSADQLMYNATLNQWEAHKAIDFTTTDGTSVLAAYAGTVESIYTNYLEGTVVVINHGDGLKTTYGSLSENLEVEEGEEVEKGDTVGTASSSAMNESESHLRFEVWKDGAKIDPSAYLNLEQK